ncbi:uncharacterized protein [Ambystoma mexicanum]|uniref:uncharacterized protein isoform X2 n=1 Tax=Ambystoma mexicanum TaxID=8296 RepID=UPI0037E9057F
MEEKVDEREDCELIRKDALAALFVSDRPRFCPPDIVTSSHNTDAHLELLRISRSRILISFALDLPFNRLLDTPDRRSSGIFPLIILYFTHWCRLDHGNNKGFFPRCVSNLGFTSDWNTDRPVTSSNALWLCLHLTNLSDAALSRTRTPVDASGLCSSTLELLAVIQSPELGFPLHIKDCGIPEHQQTIAFVSPLLYQEFLLE